MTTTTGCERMRGAARQPVILRLVRCDDAVDVPEKHTQRPTWWLLYMIGLLGFAVLGASDYLLPDGFVRSLAESVAAIACIGLTRWWLGANHCRLVRKAAQDGDGGRAVVNERATVGGLSSGSASLRVAQ